MLSLSSSQNISTKFCISGPISNKYVSKNNVSEGLKKISAILYFSQDYLI